MSGLVTRRHILRRTAGFTAGSVISFTGLSASATTPNLTPRQPLGPFYPDKLPLDRDNDLLSVNGRTGRAFGQPTDIYGQVRGLDGKPLGGVTVEIWQCDAFGRYLHSRDAGRGRSDKNFQGYGRAVSDNEGLYRFRTIKPVAYPGRTPHIHFLVNGDGIQRFVTQMYVEGEPQNLRDGLLNQVSDPEQRKSLIVPLTPSPELGESALSGRFDITVG
ncbi:protocatechuate 3,4-dioxygenase [Pelagibius sp. Alg239-R121]|uniref:protocatechuate 3,4-dioxygenase n=1 Tax=Pelagibius sp. Alg239-R121 TaxID=2993448 RepID=UPI0024A75824|nr:protocatechuate 3,4-dioxygenase [Pelagibius sp. Alg239-R121]